LDKRLKASDIFTPSGDFKKGQEATFRGWCADYISYSKGENPFTFPFRLPPPDDILAEIDRTTDFDGKPITKQRKYLQLVKSYVHPNQEEQIKNLRPSAVIDPALFVFTLNPNHFAKHLKRLLMDTSTVRKSSWRHPRLDCTVQNPL